MASFQHQPGVPGVTEIRVHGVGGTSPVSMLGRSDLVQVAGDEISGFYRSTETEAGRTIEAYSWGGLTASSASRALWVLLLPFSLVNIAGWMIEPTRDRTLDSRGGVFAGLDQAIARFGKRFKKASGRLRAAQEWLIHLLALAFTATYVQLTAYLAVDLFAFQCGGDAECRARLPLNAIFGEDPRGWPSSGDRDGTPCAPPTPLPVPRPSQPSHLRVVPPPGRRLPSRRAPPRWRIPWYGIGSNIRE